MIGSFELLRLVFDFYQNSFESKSKPVFAYLFFQANSSDSEDDEEVGLARRPGASGKKVIESSSDEDSDAGGSGT